MKHHKSKEERRQNKETINVQLESIQIVFYYLIFGIGWILLSDYLLQLMTTGAQYQVLQTYKGLVFIFLTAVIIYLLVNSRISRLNQTRKALLINQEALTKQIRLNDNIVNHSPVIILRLSEMGIIYNINDFGCQVLGLDKKDIINKNWLDVFVTPDKHERAQEIFNRVIRDGDIKNAENTVINSHGEAINMRWLGVKDQSREENTILAVGIDVTEEKKLQSELEDMAFTDQLTGLPNRIYLDKIMKDHIRSQRPFSVMILNIDNFKHVNNSVSYAVGDELIIVIAKALKDLIGNRGLVISLTGDEFAVLFHEIENMTAFLKEVKDHFDRLWSIENYEFYTSMSIGVSSYPDHGKSQGAILRNANITLERVKKSGKNNFMVFKEEFKWQNLENISLAKKMQKAIEEDIFELHYQPLVDTQTGGISSIEVLLRWPDAEEGYISPGRFIPLAEETGQIFEIEKVVFEKALNEREKLNAAGFSAVDISVNLSNKTLMNKIMFEELIERIQSKGNKVKNMTIEVTETAIISDIKVAIKRLNALRYLGFKIALDDFGTGYSSLTYLRDLPIDIVKIDQKFVKQVLDSKEDQLIMKALTELSSGLNFKVTVEGIETNEQYRYIRKLNCNSAQGYLISRPVPIKKINELLAADYHFMTS